MHGRQKTLAIGVYPAVTLANARAKRDTAKTQLALGNDPSTQKRLEKAQEANAAATTVEAVALEYLALKKDSWSKDHYSRERRNMLDDVIPWIGRRPISEVTPPELLEVLRKVEARGAIESAKRVKVTASGVWGLAIATGRAERNITLDIAKALQPSNPKNLPALVTPLEVGALLRDMHAYTGTPTVVAALKLAPILFQRPGNLRTMRWADIDLEAGLWTIPSEDMKRTKTGKSNGAPHLVPLPTQAVQIIKGLLSLNGHREYVFPGARDARRPMSEAALTVALHAMGYKGKQTWHGFRATGRTLIREELGYDPDVIEAQLAHTRHISHGGAYDRAAFIKARRPIIQEWANYLDKLRIGGDVLALPTRAA
jgi:integrase